MFTLVLLLNTTAATTTAAAIPDVGMALTVT